MDSKKLYSVFCVTLGDMCALLKNETRIGLKNDVYRPQGG